MKARRTLAVALLAGASALAPATAASADQIASKEACKDGKHASIINSETGEPYKNQGQCVAAYNAQQKAAAS